MADVRLSDMKATYYPPSLHSAFMGARPPVKNGYGSLYSTGNISYFQNYRNENLSRMQMPPYEWGLMNTPYTPRPDIAVYGGASDLDKFSKMPPSNVSMLDAVRQHEVDDFYMACQMHRDQYNDHTGSLHPLDYFKPSEFLYQCPMDPTSVYLRSPQYYVKYKSPETLPLTLERSNRCPPLPERALTGRYNPESDINYKR